jgi:serine protease Do
MRDTRSHFTTGRSQFGRSLIIISSVALALLATLYFTRHSRAHFAFAATKGLDGNDIQMLEAQNKAYERVIKATAPAIVYIRTEQVIKAEQSPLLKDPLFRQFFGNALPQMPKDLRQHSLGTGVLFDPDGYIITNNHVIDKANTMEIMLTDKRTFKAKLVGADSDLDIAVIKIDAKNLPVVPLGDSSSLQVGDTVMAFGNPFGLNFTVTRGTVSALGRSQFNIEPLQDFIQTDAPINPGNSGGALVNVKGEVVGINTAILSPGGENGGSVGVGFAIPMNMAKRSVESLIKTGKVTRGYLGVTVGPVTSELAEQFKAPDTSGALVQDVTPGAPADKAGLKPGDVIRKFDGRTVNDSSDLPALAASAPPGTPVTLEVLRNGQTLEKKITVEQRPSDLSYAAGAKKPPTEGPLRGIAVQNLTPPLRQQLGISLDVRGVVVTAVAPDSAAAQYLEQGDVILSIDHHDVTSVTDFNKFASEAKGKALLRIVHQGQAVFVVISAEGENQ